MPGHPFPTRLCTLLSASVSTTSPPLSCRLALIVIPFHSLSCFHSLAHYRQCNDTAQSLFTRTIYTKYVTHFMPRAPHSSHSTRPSCSADLELLQSVKSNRLRPRPRSRNQQRDIQFRHLVGWLDVEHHERQHRLWRSRRRIHRQAKRRRPHYSIQFLHLLRRGGGMDEGSAGTGCCINYCPRV